MPEGTTYWGVVLKQILLGLSAFAVGVMLFRAVFYERKRHRPFLAVGFLGVGLVVGIIAELVVREPLVDPELRAILYVVGVLAIGVGFTGDAVRGYKRGEVTRRHSHSGDRGNRPG